MELIRLEDITKTYHLGEVDVPVLKGISLTIDRGEMVALMGASGSGKTTLMNILGCLDRPSSGEYWFDGQEMSQFTPNQRALVRTAKLGFVFQSFNLLPRTNAVQRHHALGLLPAAARRAEAARLANLLLDRVGLADRTDHEPSQMSGGQQQRVAIARSLVNHPALLLADEPTGNLDSHTSVEILRMFQQLNAEGITVILVTHDPKVASYAHRTIRIVDGLIEGDERRGPDAEHRRGCDHHGRPTAVGNGFRQWQRAFGPGGGRRRSVAVAVAPASAAAAGSTAMEPTAAPQNRGHFALWRCPRASAVARRALADPADLADRPGGFAAEQDALGADSPGRDHRRGGCNRHDRDRRRLQSGDPENHSQHGRQQLLILPGAASSGGVSYGAGSRPTLTPEDGEQLALQCPAISDFAPRCGRTAQLVYGGKNWKPQGIVGTTPNYLNVRDWTQMAEGDVFSDRDVLNANKVCMVGTTIKRELFENESPVGKEMRISNIAFRVIGVMSSKGANMMGQDQDDVVIAPWTTVKFRVNAVSTNAVANANPTESQAPTSSINSLSNIYPNSTSLYPSISDVEQADTPQSARLVTVDNILIKAASGEQIPEAIREIKSLLRERHHIKTPREDDDTHDDFNIRDMTEITKTISQTSTLMGALLMVVAAISLIVGGVGIMNIMLVSVTERTREIGLRMAVGARSHHILRQFLVEAVVLCLVGGAVGIGVGRLASILVRFIKHWPTRPSLLVITISVAVSAAVGIIFGFYPAWKASRLTPSKPCGTNRVGPFCRKGPIRADLSSNAEFFTRFEAQ